MQLPKRRRGIPASRSRSSPRTSVASALKPVPRRVWAPVGERPIAHGRYRFDWLYVTVFASQATGENFWYLSNGISKPLFEALLETFAREAEAGLGRIILLVLDDSGWHSAASLKTLDGIRLVHLPPYSPKLQPAETLWALVDEPIVNNHIAIVADLEEKITNQCITLAEQPEQIQTTISIGGQGRSLRTNQSEIVLREFL